MLFSATWTTAEFADAARSAESTSISPHAAREVLSAASSTPIRRLRQQSPSRDLKRCCWSRSSPKSSRRSVRFRRSHTLTPGTRALGEAVEPALRKSDIVANCAHGAVAVAKDPWGAYLRMEKLEYFASIIEHAPDLNGAEQIRRLSDDQIGELKSGYGKGRRNDAEPASDRLVERIVGEIL